MDLISIIIPVYNVEKYIRESIESALNQDYSNVEIILIDDGSKDSSGNICDEYASTTVNMKVIHKVNEGLGMARNEGIKAANGNFIVFLDSDDTIDPTLLSELYENIKESDYDMVIGGYKRISENGSLISEFHYGDMSYFDNEVKRNLLPRIIGSAPNEHDSLAVSSCGVLYKKATLDDFKICFQSEREVLSEDLLFNINFIAHSKSIKTIDLSLYNYRFVEGSLTKRYLINRFSLSKKLFNIEKNYLIKDDLYEDVKYRLIKQFFLNLRMCFRQEDCKISNLKLKIAFANIRKICSDDFVVMCINDYPVYELAYKQRVFVYMVKYKMEKLIYLFVKLGVIQ